MREMVADPAYQAIIGLGEPAILLLLGELARDPDWWFSALNAITGAKPVLPEDRGNLVKMAQSWIEWGRSKGYRLPQDTPAGVPMFEAADPERMPEGG
jgi:hypothetical protein